ncbi:unnamed protein product [Adineta ricciae]|uniref:Carrier domain-containing protein n=1 Tax=Adineta ricciae TaxID=249248 RepID=A0A814TZB9_ADIRI|nr:unnamed protein product [Adineta ricciae]
MIPSKFIVLEKLPLNSNGKIDRKLLPAPNFATAVEIDHIDVSPLTSLEEQLLSIFARSFHHECRNPNMSFAALGGTSLDVIRAVALIRQELYSGFEFQCLVSNPSVRELARILQPLVVAPEETTLVSMSPSLADNHNRPCPSLFIEAIGILVLMYQWFYPIWWAFQSSHCLVVFIVPIIHLLLYIVFQRLLFGLGEQLYQKDTLYSWRYYRWWFLERLWSINNAYWLQHLVGTPFYNLYLRWCGARISRHAHIYTTRIDTPWLLEVGDFTVINSETMLSSMSYQDQTYELHSIVVGSHCSIDTRCMLYNGVNVSDHVHIKAMSAVTGYVAAVNDYKSPKSNSLSYGHIIYQLICLACLILIHSCLLRVTYYVYQYCLTFYFPLSVSLAVGYLFWMITSLLVTIVLLKFVVGHVLRRKCSLNSYYYLHKIWLRQLIITSFHQAFQLLPTYERLFLLLLRWLGGQADDDVKVAEVVPILRFPSNLLRIERSVTIFSRVMLAPFEMIDEVDCYFDYISLGPNSNLGNGCTLMPATQLPSNTMIGNLTRVIRETNNSSGDGVWLGIPAQRMPFILPEKVSPVNDLTFHDFTPIYSFVQICLNFLISHCLLITLYVSMPLFFTIIVHLILYCLFYRVLFIRGWFSGATASSRVVLFIQTTFSIIMSRFSIFITPFLSRSQYLVFLFRLLGARIGYDVVLPDIDCLSEPHLTTIGNYVRLASDAHIQCHTFEQRLLKLAPVTVHDSSVLESFSIVLPGSILHGQNHLLPFTLVMKNDQIPFNTTWSV